MNIYRITPENGTTISSSVTVFERTFRGPRGWTVTEVYDQEVYATEPPLADTIEAAEGIANSDPQLTEFVFDDFYPPEEQERIRLAWNTLGRDLLQDPRWNVEEDYFRLNGPVSFEAVYE
jgi:hypothetical protein